MGALDWITAVSTGLTGAVAVVAVVPAYRQLRMLREEQSADRDERGRQQAADFSFWIEHDEQVSVVWANRSSSPIHAVFGKVFVRGEMVVHFSRGTLGPTDGPVVDRELSNWLRSHLGRLLRAELGNEAVDRTDEYDDPAPDYMVAYREAELARETYVQIAFRDASGLEWQREADGRLMKLTAPSPLTDTAHWKPLSSHVRAGADDGSGVS